MDHKLIKEFDDYIFEKVVAKMVLILKEAKL
jgi:hypothetical protein